MKRIVPVVILVLIVFIVIVVGVSYLKKESPAGVSVTNESIVIQSVENIGEIALVQLGIVDIFDEEHVTKIPFIGDLIGSKRKKFVRVEFDAKLGIDGNKVVITPIGDNTYKLKVPQFIFIGYDNFHSEVAAEYNGILSWTNSEIDSTEMINAILSEENQNKYLEKYEDQLKKSTELFFTQLIKGIDPEANIIFVF